MPGWRFDMPGGIPHTSTALVNSMGEPENGRIVDGVGVSPGAVGDNPTHGRFTVGKVSLCDFIYEVDYFSRHDRCGSRYPPCCLRFTDNCPARRKVDPDDRRDNLSRLEYRESYRPRGRRRANTGECDSYRRGNSKDDLRRIGRHGDCKVDDPGHGVGGGGCSYDDARCGS